MSQLPSLLAVLPGNGLWLTIHKKEGNSDFIRKKWVREDRRFLGANPYPLDSFSQLLTHEQLKYKEA